MEVIKRLLGRLSRLFFEHLQISEGWEVIGRIFKRTLGGESGFFLNLGGSGVVGRLLRGY